MRDVRVYFQDILESIAAIERYTAGMDWDAFASNGQTQDSVIRRLEIIGEAVKGIPEEHRVPTECSIPSRSSSRRTRHAATPRASMHFGKRTPISRSARERFSAPLNGRSGSPKT